MTFLREQWKRVHNWIEAGDLILPLIIISIAHYAAVLERKDLWFVAFAIGVLIDLASYRLVKAAIRYGGWFWLEAIVMSAFAFAFHLEFYVSGIEWFYPMAAAAIPTCLVFLASLSVKERWEAKSRVASPQGSQSTVFAAQTAPQVSQKKYVCERCEKIFDKQTSFAAHKRHCRGDSTNGGNGHAQNAPHAERVTA